MKNKTYHAVNQNYKSDRIVSIDLVSQIPGYQEFDETLLNQLIPENCDPFYWDDPSVHSLVDFDAVIKIGGSTLILLDQLDDWARYYGLS